MDSLTHEEILEVLNCILFHTTEKMAGMHIRSHPHDLSDDLCCVSARFEGSCELTLALYADRLFSGTWPRRFSRTPISQKTIYPKPPENI